VHKQFPVWVSISLMALVISASVCASAASTPVPTTPTALAGLSTLAPTTTPNAGKTRGIPDDVPVKPQKGFRAPDFVLLNLEGKEVSLGDLGGRPVLINFWATWCPPCREELPVIQATYQNSDDLAVLGVNFQEGLTNVKPFVEKEGLTFPVLLDEEGRVATMYRTRGLPTSFFLNPDGIITAVHIGPMTANDVDNYVTQARGK
jgi:thiol-disulfide isomerase/thioredoxin